MYGLDLHQLWRSRQFTRIADLLDGLSAQSRYREALLDDPEIAAMVLDQEEQEQATNPDPVLSVRQFSPEVIMAVYIVRTLETLIEATTGKKQAPKTLPAPHTAVDAEREKRARGKHEQLMGIFLPHENE